MTYASLFNDEAVELAKQAHEKYGDEIALSLLGLPCEEFRAVSYTHLVHRIRSHTLRCHLMRLYLVCGHRQEWEHRLSVLSRGMADVTARLGKGYGV